MPFRVIDIDHLMIRVANLERAVEAFRSLGFTVAPPRHLSAATMQSGVGASDGGEADRARKSTFNHRHVLFRPPNGRTDVANFLELMAVEDQLRTPPALTQMMCFLLDSEGPKMIVCSSDDVVLARDEMIADGIETSMPIALESGWHDEEHDRFLPVSARPIVPVYGQTPFMVNTADIAPAGRESLRHEPWTQHPNGAKYLAGVTGITEELREHAQLMADRVFGSELEWESADSALIRPRDLFFRMVTPTGFAALYPGLDYSRERILPALCGASVAVESVDATRRVLEANGIEHHDTPTGGIAVPRHAAANTIIEFVAA
jgi:hypothetical protein